MANACEPGSLMRSGYTAIQRQPATSTRRATAARPGHPDWKRSIHENGLRAAPKELAVKSAVSAATYSTVPMRATVQVAIMKRWVTV